MYDVIVIGSGMGSLSAAALLVKEGLKPLIIEQNWIPGGCTTSYWRKGYVFEAGATTLIGLDKGMPLRYLLDQTGIKLNLRKLDLPMQVHLADGQTINKYQNINQWKTEATKHFGKGQDKFWDKAFRLSEFVWNASTRFQHFPPSGMKDIWELAKYARPNDLLNARYALKRTSEEINTLELSDNHFQKYINEQLLITAQNTAEEVNFLFGAAALCYTNYSNFYVDGGLINLVKPIVSYIEAHGGRIIYREAVENIKKVGDLFHISTKKSKFKSKMLVSGIPINNLEDISPELIRSKTKQILPSEKLVSAFQMGIAFKSDQQFESIHHQIHLEEPLAETGSKSIFISLNHEEDTTRSDVKGVRIASVSTHIHNPANTMINSEKLEKAIIQILVQKRFIRSSEDILYAHSSGPKSWNKWTGRKYGFVGGYPQYFSTKPWNMVGSRLDTSGAYQCGDSTYPGQGIPGVTLSGIIAAKKLISDIL